MIDMNEATSLHAWAMAGMNLPAVDAAKIQNAVMMLSPLEMYHAVMAVAEESTPEGEEVIPTQSCVLEALARVGLWEW
jgi:hypothetical protein